MAKRHEGDFRGPAARAVFLLAVAILVGSCADRDLVPESTVARARDALGPFRTELFRALTTAMRDGGPEEALVVCRVRAGEIAASASSETVEVGRTSHRLRNPQNAPAPWMEPLLREYEANPADRTPRAVRLDDRHVGYVEPIHVQSMCLTCHGEELDPALEERLQELYPQDQATGFRENDFRGLFWVKLVADGPDEPARGTRSDPS